MGDGRWTMTVSKSAQSGLVVRPPTSRLQCPFFWALAALILFSAPAYAQNTKAWSEPYKSGQDAIKAGKYQEAAQFLETAVKANSKAEANKRTEGVFSTDYFPYYYLGIAYYELHQYDKAKENLDKAANPQPKDKNDIAKLKDYTAKTLVALNTTKPPAGPVINAAFTNALQNGDTALQAKHWQDATAAYDQARTVDPAAYQQGNVQARRDQAVHSWASELNTAGHTLLPTSLSQAKAKFTQAEQLVPGSAADGMNLVKQRETDYQTAKAGIEPDITGKNFKAAKDKLDRARTANPEQFTIDKLDARLTVVNAGLAAPGNLSTLNNTANTGTKDALDKNGKLPPSATAPDTTKDSLRTALLALANGDAQNSITILEPIQQQAAVPATAAALHAYLGVAYATRAFSSAKSDEQSRLSGKALEQFKLALSSQHDFQLSKSIVSPKILQMFEQARR
jgi:tetratricopeptide (TPR) repeat protein